MKIAFFGTPDFTIEFLEVLKSSGFCPSLIVTNPDRPSGRGMVMTSPLPKKWADEKDIKVLQPEKLGDEVFEELSKESWDLFVVIAYGKVIPEKIIYLPKFGTINVHYSLLPKYRGMTPIERAILYGDTKTGVCIQQMRKKLDTGPIISKKEVAISPTETSQTLRDKLNKEAVKMLPETIENIFKNLVTPEEQDESQSSYYSGISKEDGLINLDDDPITLDRKWRAYQGWPGLYFFQDGKRIKITKAHLENGRFVVEEVVPEGGKRMQYQSFVK